MNSFNHYAYGAVFDWIFSNTLGIKLLQPAYQEIAIKVLPDKRLGYASGGIITKYGRVNVSWYYKKEEVKLEIEIPNGITCHVLLENKTIDITNGKYSFTL